jgi:hypothetical protein
MMWFPRVAVDDDDEGVANIKGVRFLDAFRATLSLSLSPTRSRPRVSRGLGFSRVDDDDD